MNQADAIVRDETQSTAAESFPAGLLPEPSGEGPASPNPLAAAGKEADRCIQCGFCLPACPTYKAFGIEKHSPRGRIRLVKAWSEGDAEPEADLLAALDLCLDCRACETACPIDVRYGVVISRARDELAERRASGRIGGLAARARALVLKFGIRHVAAKPRRLRLAAGVAARVLSGRIGDWLEHLARRRPDSWLAAALTFARAVPKPVDTPTSSSVSSTSAAAPAPSSAPKAALFLGCAQEGLFPETNRATAALLRRAGFSVEVPKGQVCCGALHRHNGDKQTARELVLQNLRAFGAFAEHPVYDVVATNAGGCLAWIKEAAELFPPDSAEHRAARRFAERARDISEILAEAGAPLDAAGPRVVYQPSCHLANVCGVTEPPLELLRALHGDNVTLPPDGGSCCGSAGIYNALHPHASRAILNGKMDAVLHVRPDVIVTSNPGCHLQMLAGVKARGLEDRIRVVQLAEWLNERTAPDSNENRGEDE